MVWDEAALLRSALEGDGRAFGRLVEPSVDGLYRLALRILGSEAEAEDAVQEALYKAWRALPTFRGGSKFSTWLYRITWRASIDLARRRRAVPLEFDVEDISTDPEDHMERAQERRDIEEALGRLSLPHRTVLTLHYIEDRSIGEIGEILDLPVGTVKAHLHRARKALKSALAGREGS